MNVPQSPVPRRFSFAARLFQMRICFADGRGLAGSLNGMSAAYSSLLELQDPGVSDCPCDFKASLGREAVHAFGGLDDEVAGRVEREPIRSVCSPCVRVG